MIDGLSIRVEERTTNVCVFEDVTGSRGFYERFRRKLLQRRRNGRYRNGLI